MTEKLPLTCGEVSDTMPLQGQTADAERLSSCQLLLEFGSEWDDYVTQYRESVRSEEEDLLNLWCASLERSFGRDRRSMMTLRQVHLAYGELVHVEYDADEGPEIWPGEGPE